MSAEYDGFWIGGVNSLVHPSSLPNGQFAWGYNVLNRGGIVQTRPGFRYRAAIVGENLQGMRMFRRQDGVSTMLVAVDGRIWVADPPFTTFRRIDDLVFSASAPAISMEPCLRSTKRATDGTLSLITPKPMISIMDGESASAYWDGNEGKHNNPDPPYYGTPVGLWQAWVGSRLWFSRGSQIFASDLGDPTTSSEDSYLAGQSGFQLSSDCTGFLRASNPTALLAFTQESTTAFKAYIRDRSQWNTTERFQDEILPDIGCLAQRTAINQFGVAKWFSQHGFIDFDAARNALVSSSLAVTDSPMMRSKRLLYPDMSGACAIAYENMVFLSVPAGSRRNSHTWALDMSPVGSGAGGSPAWAGAWIGPQPAQWGKATIYGRQRLFCASHDVTTRDETKIHIWEALDETREDNDGNRIKCQFVTKQTFTEGMRKKFLFAEISVVEMLGLVGLKAYVSGARGKSFEILDTTLSAEKGSIGAPGQTLIRLDTIMEAYRPQSRMVTTQEFTMQDADCHAETEEAGIDNGFQITVEWTGRMGIASIVIYTKDAEGNKAIATCYDSEAAEVNKVTEAGESHE